MKTWQIGKTLLCVNPDTTREDAYVEPATWEQIEALGKVVIGEAWMTSQPYKDGPAVIKFAPPQIHFSAEKAEQQALWNKCYQKIIIISEREELTALTLPLPGAHPHLVGNDDAIKYAVSGLCEQLKRAKRLQRLDIYTANELHVVALIDELVDR